jgi:hypothetical protein
MGEIKRKGDGLVPFLANLQKYRALLDAGYTARTVHDRHVDELKISYRQFLRYVHKYIKDDSRDTRPEPGNRAHQNESLPRQTEPGELAGKRKPPFEMRKYELKDLI